MSAPTEEPSRGSRDDLEYDEPVQAVEWGVATVNGEGVGRLDEKIARSAAHENPDLTLICREVVLHPWKVVPTD